MAKILFVDDRLNEVMRQWRNSECANIHELLPLEPFDSIERTCHLVETFKPHLILIGYVLGNSEVTGADVILALRKRGYAGRIFANSGGSVEQFNQAGVEVDGAANRNPCGLDLAVNNLT